MLVPGGLITLLKAASTPKDQRSPKQQSCLEATQAKLLKLKLRSSRPRFECQYCNELKETKHFIKGILLPWNCQPHLTGPNRVCKTCLQRSISAQLDAKPLLDVGCPQCGIPWEPTDLRVLASSTDAKRLKHMDERAQHRTFVPKDLDLPDDATLDDLLKRGARLCPGCLFPFVKIGGCDSMLCTKCGKYFHVAYAPVLEDGKGRRAVDLGEDVNTDLW